MTFDGLTLTAMASELRRQLIDSRVQKVIQPDAWSIALEAYGGHRRRWLLLSAEPRRPRVYLTAEKPGRGTEAPSPLLLLLRKHIEGARIGEIAQPTGERVLSFAFDRRGHSDVERPGDDPTLPRDREAALESAPNATFRLIIEAISQYSNLILVDADGVVMDSARRVTAEQNRHRVTLPRHPYQPPPAQSKRSLENVDWLQCRDVLPAAESGGPVWQALVAGFAGIGPLTAREIVFRAVGDAKARIPADAPSQDDLARRLEGVLADVVAPVFSGSAAPSIARDGEALVAFAPYPLTHLGQWEARASLSAAAEEYYRQEGGTRAVDVARRTFQTALAAERSLADRKRESLLRALEGSARADEFRQRGDLLLTYGAGLRQGAASMRANGIEIDLDPRLTAIENAQAFFRRYQKARAALREVPTLLQEAELRLRYLDEVAALAELAETSDDVRVLRTEIRPERKQPPRKTKRKPAPRSEASILRLRATDGTEILVGRSARQNHEVTFELARPDDVWLHARGCPGAHVVLRVNGGAPPPRAIDDAARIAAYYSANRSDGRVTVDWTRRGLVRRLGKGTPGLVSYSGEQSVVVKPERRASPQG
ncbi:MAG: Rqc2 family fibronectin-binding protein [Chloroflexota bacterium]